MGDAIRDKFHNIGKGIIGIKPKGNLSSWENITTSEETLPERMMKSFIKELESDEGEKCGITKSLYVTFTKEYPAKENTHEISKDKQ